MIAAPAKKEDRIRGSINVPLSPDGRAQARERALQIARKGGVHTVISSSLLRAVETASAVKEANPKATFKEMTGALHPWHMGGLEGKPTADVVGQMNALILHFPDRIPPALPKGSPSTENPESFNHYQRRFFAFLGGVIQRYLQAPSQKILLVTHYRVVKLLQAWEVKGFPEDFAIDYKEVTRKDGVPGSAHELIATNIHDSLKGKWADWKLIDPKMESLQSLQPGIIVLRHGFTALNGENPGGPS